MQEDIFSLKKSILLCPTFYSILCTFNRRRELARLVAWAQRKGLSHPLRLYQNRLSDEEMRLNGYCLRHRHLTTWAYRIHWLNGLLFPTPRYPSRGIAAIYRNPNLTTRSKKSYSLN